MEIIEEYLVNVETNCLVEVAHIDYATLVIETHRQFYVKQTPFEIIKRSCLEGGADYNGRRIAVMFLTGVKRKVMIPVNPGLGIYAFPTKCPNSFGCCWIFYHHVKHIKPNLSLYQPTTLSVITFNNGQQINLNESYYILEKQMNRTAACILKFSPLYRSPVNP